MLPWTRSKWFRRAVTVLSTIFVGVVLATSLLAEGSALKRHSVPYASIKCPKGHAAGRARPQGGCAGGKAIVIKPKTKNGPGTVKVDYAALAREMSGMTRFAKPGARGLRGERGPRGTAGERGRIGLSGTRGHTGRAGTQGPRGANGSVGVAGHPGKDGARGAQGDRGESGKDGADGRDGMDGADGADG